MKKINVIVLGNGHITKTRHLSVLKGFSNKFIITV